MTVPIYTINTSTPNSGTGDSIYAAFNKVNTNEQALASAVNAIQSSYANVNYGYFTNVAVANQVIGSLYLNSGTIYVNGSPVATAAATFPGGNVPLIANFTNTISSTTTTNGAVVMAGGLGLGGNLNAGGIGVFYGNLVAASGTDSSGTTSGALISTGGLGVALNTHLGQGLYVSGVATVGSTLGVSGVTTITSATASSGTGSGALVVQGGVGIGGALNVGGNVILSNVIVTGTLTANTAGVITSAVIDLNTPVTGAALTTQTTSNVGLGIHYYDSAGAGDSHAFAGRIITGTGFLSNAFAYYASSTDPLAGPVTGTQLGTIVGGSLIAANTTAASGYTSGTAGAMYVAGGAGIAGSLYVGGTVYGTLGTASQPNITSVGTLGSLSVTNGITSASQTLTGTLIAATVNAATVNAATVNAATIGNASAVLYGTLNSSSASQPNITTLSGVTSIGASSATTITGTLSTASQPNITSVGTLGSLAVTGTTHTGTLIAATVNAATIGNASAVLYGTLNSSSASQPNITSVGTLTGLIVNGGTLGGTAGNQVQMAQFASSNGNNNQLLITDTRTSTGTSWTNAGTRIQEKIDSTWMGYVQFNGAVQGGISFGTGTSTAGATSVTDKIYIDSSGNFYPAGNVAQSLGASTAWWSTVYGQAVQAQYADLAERYVADAVYEPGTVVVFGGNEEITVTEQFADVRVAGAISTDPAYLMNSASPGLPVALRGKVPTKLFGPVTRGDLLVTCDSRPGFAVSVGQNTQFGHAVFAKSLTTDLTEGEKVITAVII